MWTITEKTETKAGYTATHISPFTRDTHDYSTQHIQVYMNINPFLSHRKQNNDRLSVSLDGDINCRQCDVKCKTNDQK